MRVTESMRVTGSVRVTGSSAGPHEARHRKHCLGVRVCNHVLRKETFTVLKHYLYASLTVKLEMLLLVLSVFASIKSAVHVTRHHHHHECTTSVSHIYSI